LNQKYLTVKQIYEKYGIKPTKTYWYIREGKIFYAKIGKSVLIPEKDFQIFLTNHTRRPINEEDYKI